MKLLRVTSVKNSTLCNYLNRNICNIKLSYQETIHSIGMDLPHSLLLSQVFGEFGINTLDVIHDLDLLQERWFKENGLNIPKGRVNCLYKQIEFFKPDVLYFQDLDSLPIVEFEKLKINFPFVRSIVIFKGSYIALLPNCFDLVITCTPNLLQHYKNQGFKTKLVYHGYDDRFESCYSNTFTTNFSFIGSTGYGFGTTHSTRFITLQYLLEHTDIRIWSNEQIHDRSHNIHYLLNDIYQLVKKVSL
jgi:hypothetical protein